MLSRETPGSFVRFHDDDSYPDVGAAAAAGRPRRPVSGYSRGSRGSAMMGDDDGDAYDDLSQVRCARPSTRLTGAGGRVRAARRSQPVLIEAFSHLTTLICRRSIRLLACPHPTLFYAPSPASFCLRTYSFGLPDVGAQCTFTCFDDLTERRVRSSLFKPSWPAVDALPRRSVAALLAPSPR